MTNVLNEITHTGELFNLHQLCLHASQTIDTAETNVTRKEPEPWLFKKTFKRIFYTACLLRLFGCHSN